MENYIIERTIRTRLKETGTGKGDPQHVVTIKLDYSNVDESEILKRAARTDVITFQNKNRELSVEDYLSMDGETFHVNDFTGQSSRATVVKELSVEEYIAKVNAMPEGDEKTRILEMFKKMSLDRMAE